MDREDWVALAEATVREEAGRVDAAAHVAAPVTTAETARLAALHEYRLLDAPADDELSAVVRAAAAVAGVPHATLNLIDGHRQCQLTAVGFEGGDSPRADSMCALHFEDGELVVVPDASLDERYARNPWVDGRLGAVRFYASAPLLTPDGHALGSLCVFDTAPGRLSEQQADVLRDLAGVLVALFERRRQARRADARTERAGEARELALLAMAESEARWELSEVVAETIDVGLVVVDADGHVRSLNRTARWWHGTGDEPQPHPTYFAADGTTVLDGWDLPWLRALRDGTVEGAEVVLDVPGRPRRVLECSGRAMRRADGSPLGAVVALSDVTRDREREQALAQAHAALAEHSRRVQDLADASRALAAAEDPVDVICGTVRDLTNADAAYLLRPDTDGDVRGLRAVATSGYAAGRVFYPEGEPSLGWTCFASGQPVFVADMASHQGASQRLVASSGVVSGAWHPVVLPGQRAVGVLGVFWRTPVPQLPDHVLPVLQTLSGELAHAAERAELLQRLARAAERDPLTGLANRRRWDQAISTEVARATRGGAPLTLALLDLDHFKTYNDTHGHLGGDDLLREFATAAGGCLREVDTLARWGGEEFVVALPGCSVDDAVAVADRIRAAVPRGQTCTVGVAQWEPGELPADVVARADAALYRGKQQGRDVTVVHRA
ncbi:diguanylate cyclase domain-containing protein [Kineococcus aurantiacus]|uniref:Diguanylate cyclase (GGDEF)-like protein n=1 Tax=Kineococcus aurantiacus TaxID=37633 RepID=A0A7Y9DL55_9ACTN|nr:diguanylate cyclase (GGDEF)-like protein [Kineococcus aurantiacus]